MKRFHVNLSVRDLSESIRFYTMLFAAEPNVRKADYAKWMLEDPRINFAISERGYPVGVNHLGIQVESDAELSAMREQLTRADHALVEQSGAACCYAHSDKYWVADPSGIAWETFHTLDTIPIYGADTDVRLEEITCCATTNAATDEPCCTPAEQSGACCA
jgi:catechol 2,3-dioxygenase-like lactoylglutathione lyase family enzyme